MVAGGGMVMGMQGCCVAMIRMLGGSSSGRRFFGGERQCSQNDKKRPRQHMRAELALGGLSWQRGAREKESGVRGGFAWRHARAWPHPQRRRGKKQQRPFRCAQGLL